LGFNRRKTGEIPQNFCDNFGCGVTENKECGRYMLMDLWITGRRKVTLYNIVYCDWWFPVDLPTCDDENFQQAMKTRVAQQQATR
jgi:hypothetical protein